MNASIAPQPSIKTGRTGAARWKRILPGLVILFLFALGISIRLVHVTSPKMYPAWRQLYAAIVSRGMYYQMTPDADPYTREQAILVWQEQDHYEAPIFPAIVALVYKVIGGEHLWVSRLFAILFWMLGGLALVDLTRRMTSWFGSFVSLAFYLFVPFGVLSSRWFQSEPLLVMGLLISAYAIYRWLEGKSWRWTVAAGLACGLTILIKVVAIFPLVLASALAITAAMGLSGAFKSPKFWVFVLLSGAIPAAYYFGSIGQSSSGYFDFWTLSMLQLLLRAKTYSGWITILNTLYGLPFVGLGLIGIFLFKSKDRPLLIGLWLGYVAFGFALPFQIYTHDYYSLMLLPILALSLAPFGRLIAEKGATQPRFWQAALALMLLAGVVYEAWLGRNEVITIPTAGNEAWVNMGEELPKDGEIIALTHDYGVYLSYYAGRHVALWPYVEDMGLDALRGGGKITDFESFFKTKTAGYRYFVVTHFGQFDSQPDLKAYLYEHYAMIKEGDGYLLFDLEKPASGQ